MIAFTKDELNVLTVLERGLRNGEIFLADELLPDGMDNQDVERTLRTLRTVCQKVANNLTEGLEKA